MQMRKQSWISLLLAAGAGLLLAGALDAEEFWKKKPASEWTEEEALKIVQNSPWAKEELVAVVQARPLQTTKDSEEEFPQNLRRSSSPGDPAQRQAPSSRAPSPPDIVPQSATDGAGVGRYLVRWESAGPVEDAFARLEELGLRSSALFHSPAPRLPENRYVVTVKITRPAEPGPDLFDDMSLDALRKRARLKTRHGEVAAAEAERSGSGATAAVHFFFYRDFSGKPLLESGREKVEFHFRGERFSLETEFEVRKDDVR